MTLADLPSLFSLLFMFASGALLTFLACREYVHKRLRVAADIVAERRQHAYVRHQLYAEIILLKKQHAHEMREAGAKAVTACTDYFRRGFDAGAAAKFLRN